MSNSMSMARSMHHTWTPCDTAPPSHQYAAAVYRTCTTLNKFIFEIPMMDSIGTVTSSTNKPILSWTKYCEVSPTSTWPLSKRSAPYVKDLTMLIGFHDPGDYHEFACQQAHLESFVDSLTTRHSLTKLAIDVRARSPRPKSFRFPI